MNVREILGSLAATLIVSGVFKCGVMRPYWLVVPALGLVTTAMTRLHCEACASAKQDQCLPLASFCPWETSYNIKLLVSQILWRLVITHR